MSPGTSVLVRREGRSVIIAGVDPGTLRMGVCLVEQIGSRLKPVLIDTIAPKASLERTRRLYEIFRVLSNVFLKHRPRAVFVERAYVAKDPQAAIALGEARGIVAVAAGQVGARFVDLAPSTAKKAVTGKGNADKFLVKRMVERILDTEILGRLDSSDAAALAVAGAMRMPPREPDWEPKVDRDIMKALGVR